MRILLVEDDPMIGAALETALNDAAYAVDRVATARAALAAIRSGVAEAILLDLTLPDGDGLEVLRRAREGGSRTPIVILTARDALDSRVRGLDLGADDYVTKPFAIEELLARLRAVVRRRAGGAHPLLSNGDISLDPATHEAARGGQSHRLSAREFALLHALLSRPGMILTRSQLEERVYAHGEEVVSNAIEFLIHGVRRKLGADAILNVRGAGWMVERGR